MNSGTPKTWKNTYYTAKSALSFVQLLTPNKQWNMIKAKVWARLTLIWALVPLNHYIALIVPLRVNTFLPSKTLARPSLIVQNGRQNGTEQKFSKYSFYELLIYHLKTNNFLRPKTVQMNSGTPKTYKKTYYTAKSAFTFVRLLTPKKQWNVIKAKVWARLTPIWALVPQRICNIPRQHQWIQGPRQHRKRLITRQNPRFLSFSC